jgi:hypothetical protein
MRNADIVELFDLVPPYTPVDIHHDRQCPDPTHHRARSRRAVAEAQQFQASILADVGGRRGTLGGGIQPLSKSMKVAGLRSRWKCGPATT